MEHCEEHATNSEEVQVYTSSKRRIIPYLIDSFYCGCAPRGYISRCSAVAYEVLRPFLKQILQLRGCYICGLTYMEVSVVRLDSTR